MTATQQRNLNGLKALVTGATSAWVARSLFSSRGTAPTSLCMAATRGAVSRRSKKSSCRGVTPTSSPPTSPTPRASPVSPRRLATSTSWSTTPGSRCGDPRRRSRSRPSTRSSPRMYPVPEPGTVVLLASGRLGLLRGDAARLLRNPLSRPNRRAHEGAANHRQRGRLRGWRRHEVVAKRIRRPCSARFRRQVQGQSAAAAYWDVEL